MTLFPNKLNEDYEGSKLAIYGLYPIFALHIFRSLVHFLSENAGLVGIATIKELPIIDTIAVSYTHLTLPTTPYV